MAIGRASNHDDKKNKADSLDEIEKKLFDTMDQIRKTLGNTKDKNDISDEKKVILRADYSKASGYARELSQRYTDREKQEKYAKLCDQLSDQAKKYGSVIKNEVPKTTFDDVKGLDGVKKLVKSFLFMAQNDEVLKYYKIDGGLGMMMYGAPGTGKTMFAEAIANAMNLPLFVVTPADIFKSYVGASEQAVKQIFDELDACPNGAILFVDECESIFSRRTQDTKDYKAAVTTELLQRINGFGVNGSKRILIAATNRPDVIDPAYLRYKRFSHLIHIEPPDREAKRAIIEGKLKNIELDGVTVDDVLAMTERVSYQETSIGKVPIVAGYYSAADICGLVEEACRIAIEQIQAANSSKPIPLTKEMFEKAAEKVVPSISAKMLEEYKNFRKGE